MYNVRDEWGELVLRHLYDMNESDFREACKYGLGGASGPAYWLQQFELYEDRPIEGHGKNSGIKDQILKRVKVRGGLKLIHYTFAPECLRYLLSKGFDVFELIPQCKARYMYDFSLPKRLQ